MKSIISLTGARIIQGSWFQMQAFGLRSQRDGIGNCAGTISTFLLGSQWVLVHSDCTDAWCLGWGRLTKLLRKTAATRVLEVSEDPRTKYSPERSRFSQQPRMARSLASGKLREPLTSRSLTWNSMKWLHFLLSTPGKLLNLHNTGLWWNSVASLQLWPQKEALLLFIAWFCSSGKKLIGTFQIFFPGIWHHKHIKWHLDKSFVSFCWPCFHVWCFMHILSIILL